MLKVAVGDEHTCVILTDTSMKCFGRNDKGQIVHGDNVDRGALKGSMGGRYILTDSLQSKSVYLRW